MMKNDLWRRAALVAGVALALAAPAAAQIQTLPEQSRGEARASGINQGLATQGQNRGVVQQNQFEVNSLRGAQPQPTPTPPPVGIVVPRR